jgi:hypothetical protein
MEETTMGATTANGEAGAAATDVHERARQGVEHLQAAVRELIKAARAALDVAEEVVNDPESVAVLASTLAGLGDLARRAAGGGGWPSPAAEAPEPPADPSEGRVQRITVA